MKSFKISVKKMFLLFAMLMLGTTFTFAQVVTLPNIAGKVGSTVTVPINVTGLSTNVKSYQFTLSYDKTKIDITGASNTGTISDVSNSAFQQNADLVNGNIKVAWASPTAITSTSGVLLNLTVYFKAAGVSTLDVGTTFLLNSTQITVTAGSATAASVEVYAGSVTNAAKNVEVLIPIYTSALVTSDNVRAFNTTLSYDATKLSILGYTLVNSLGVNGTTAENNTVAGTYQLSWASGATNPITTTTDGVLFYVRAKMLVKGSTDLSITAFQYNSGTPAVAMRKGTITAVNVTPVWGTNTTTYSVNENVAVAFNLLATDTDADVLAYSFTSTPTGVIPATALNTATGAFSWTPDYTTAGTYTLVFSVTDGTVTVTTPLTVTITVSDVNRTPTLTLNPNLTSYTVAETTPLNIQLVGADSDTDNTLKYSFTSTATVIPSSALNTSTGAFSWTPTAAQSGTYVVVFKVEDYKGTTALGTSATKTVTIFVSNTNQAPVFTSVPSTPPTIPVVKAPNPVYYTFQYVATDVDGQTLTYSLIAGPTGASITTAGMFSWAPTAEQAGKTYVVTVQVTDGVVAVTSTVNLTTSSTITGVEETPTIPTEFSLSQNYPNPFNPTTTITFGLPSESNVRLSIFNIIGQEVAVVVNNTMAAGFHKVNFNASKLTSGMYLYRIQAGDFVQIRKMLLMK